MLDQYGRPATARGLGFVPSAPVAPREGDAAVITGLAGAGEPLALADVEVCEAK